VPSDDGDFEVTTIDDLELHGESALFLKIDVEGAELSVLEGAKNSMERAENFVVLFEAHPDQVKRTQIDPMEILDFITSIKACDVVMSLSMSLPPSLLTKKWLPFW